MAKVVFYESEVSGSTAFPIDMLRYDRAMPSREQDSIEISNSIDRMHPRAVRQVRVRSTQPLTSSRWESFGWRLISSLSRTF